MSDQLAADHVAHDATEGVSVRSSRRAPAKKSFGSIAGGLGAPVFLLLMFAVFSFLRPETFPTWTNITTIVSTQSILIVVAIGVLFPLIVGEFDLSVGAVLGFCAMLAAVLSVRVGLSVPLVLLITIAAAAVIGILNGMLVEFFHVSAFIATLATATIISGLVLGVSGGNVVPGVPPELTQLGRSEVFGVVQVTIVYALVLMVVSTFVLEKTPLGRFMYATGGNPIAARLAGVPTRRIRVIAFVLSALCAGLAGLMNVATAGAAAPDTGPGYLLAAYAGAFLGATTIRPGRFNPIGTVIAILMLAVGIAGLQQMSAPYWIAPVFNGAALLIAVIVAQLRRRR